MEERLSELSRELHAFEKEAWGTAPRAGGVAGKGAAVETVAAQLADTMNEVPAGFD